MKFPDETARTSKRFHLGRVSFHERECDLIGPNEESSANAKATYLAPHPPLHLSPTSPCFIVGKLEELDDSLPSEFNGPL